MPTRVSGSYLQVTLIDLGGEISAKGPFIVFEDHDMGKHDPKRNFRAEISPLHYASHKKGWEDYLKMMIRCVGFGESRYADKPTSPVTLRGWEWVNDKAGPSI